GQVRQRIVQRRLASADAHGLDAALQGRDPLIQHVDGGVVDPAVTEAVSFEIEQGGAVRGRIESVRYGLVDRYRYRMSRGIGLITAVNRDGLASHRLSCMGIRCT